MIVLASSVYGEQKQWTELRSPHFRLLTNGGTSDGKDVLFNLEVMRAIFESRFPKFRLDSPAVLTVLATKDEATAKMLLPGMWANPGPKPGGIYVHGWEREYALVRLDVTGHDPETFHTIYHEYVHSLLHINFQWLPPWLDEGLSEFYGHTLFTKERVYVGAPVTTGSASYLAGVKPIPLPEFISSPLFSKDKKKTELSYMQAWGFIHFLCFAPGMDHGGRLVRFIEELQHGVEQKKAFINTIGNLDDVQKQYESYIQGLPDRVWTFPMPVQVKEKDFLVRKMTSAETNAELAAWFIRCHLWENATALAEAAVESDPKLALAQEDLGFVDFNKGNDDQALKDFRTAYQYDDKDYIALFASTMAARTDRPALSGNLKQVIQLKPDFAPAYIELAKLDIATGDLETALAMSRKAVELEPLRAGYRTFNGWILLRMNKPSEAAAEAAYVGQRWGGSDRDEALELWNKIPASQRNAEFPTPPQADPEVLSATGIVERVTCNGSDFAITLDVNGKPEFFKSRGFPVGFSDTLWVGEDHFTPCFHVDGLRAMLRYHPPKDGTYSGDLIYGGFRDDFSFPEVREDAKSPH